MHHLFGTREGPVGGGEQFGFALAGKGGHGDDAAGAHGLLCDPLPFLAVEKVDLVEHLDDAGVVGRYAEFGENLRDVRVLQLGVGIRSEEHTSELQSLMRTSYAVFCLKKKNTKEQLRGIHLV